MNKLNKILFHPGLVQIVNFCLVIGSIIYHSFTALAVLASILLINNLFLTVILYITRKMNRASMLAFKAMWSKLSIVQRKELEDELKNGLLNKSEETPKSIEAIIKS